MYEQFPNDANVLANTHESIRRKLLQGDLSRNALYHSLNKDPIYVRCYFPPKVHKWLYNVSVWSSISDWLLYWKCVCVIIYFWLWLLYWKCVCIIIYFWLWLLYWKCVCVIIYFWLVIILKMCLCDHLFLIGYYTEKASSFLDYFFKSLVKEFKSYF